MMSNKRILEVARDQVLLIPEPIEGYRAEIVQCLMKVIATQNDGHSDAGRKKQVAKEVEALGTKVAGQLRSES